MGNVGQELKKQMKTFFSRICEKQKFYKSLAN